MWKIQTRLNLRIKKKLGNSTQNWPLWKNPYFVQNVDICSKIQIILQFRLKKNVERKKQITFVKKSKHLKSEKKFRKKKKLTFVKESIFCKNVDTFSQIQKILHFRIKKIFETKKQCEICEKFKNCYILELKKNSGMKKKLIFVKESIFCTKCRYFFKNLKNFEF